jgi:hypothetical protein
VFKVDTAGTETVLHSFTGPEGRVPEAVLVLDAAGNLNGTAEAGGGRMGSMRGRPTQARKLPSGERERRHPGALLGRG